MGPSRWQQSGLQFHQILVVAANRATSVKLGEMMRGFCTHGFIAWTASASDALEMTTRLKPQLVFVEERKGFDGLSFVRQLRRSTASSRKAPVILLAQESTVGALRAAQNAGVHEFLVTPATAEHLLKRLDAVCGPPRTWFQTATYVGPDRRRFNSAVPENENRRQADPDQARSINSANRSNR